MKRVRITLKYVVQLPDDFDTTTLTDPGALAGMGVRGLLSRTQIADIEPGARLKLDFLDRLKPNARPPRVKRVKAA